MDAMGAMAAIHSGSWTLKSIMTDAFFSTSQPHSALTLALFVALRANKAHRENAAKLERKASAGRAVNVALLARPAKEAKEASAAFRAPEARPARVDRWGRAVATD